MRSEIFIRYQHPNIIWMGAKNETVVHKNCGELICKNMMSDFSDEDLSAKLRDLKDLEDLDAGQKKPYSLMWFSAR